MSIIKQISIFNGSNWEQAADIGANAENIDFTYTTGSQAGNTAALSSILPAQVLTASKVLTTDSNGKLSSSSISSGVFNAMLSGATTANGSFQSQIDTLNTNLAPTEIIFTPGSSFSLGGGSSFIKINNICIFNFSGTFNTSPLNMWTNYLVGTFSGYVAKYRAFSIGSDNNMNFVLLQLDANSNAIYARPLANAAHEDLIRGQLIFIIK